jgi:uncharacterized membrane protein
MSSQETGMNPSPTRSWLNWVISGLALAGLVISGLLVSQSLSGDPIAGCGGGSSCHDVLNSRWSVVLGIPVALSGFLVYAVFLIALLRKNVLLSSLCLGLILGAVGWFVFVQAVVIGRFCPWCMAGHGIGISIVGLALWREKMRGNAVWVMKITGAFAAMTVMGIAAMQVFGPLPVTHQLGDADGGPESQALGIHALGVGRKAEFDDGRKIYNVATLPHLGRPEAKHVMVEYFDYQCASCRMMRGYLSALIEKHPADICVILLPVPLDHGCNSALSPVDKGHPGSCELTRIALAVWRVNPDFFPTLHWEFLSDPPLDPVAAMAFAREKVSASELESAMHDPWIDALIRANIADWITLSAQKKHLPKLLITGKRVLHGLPSGEADFIRVMEQELGLQSNP